jgi:crossover junction endodeoxyribonuclease RuvC
MSIIIWIDPWSTTVWYAIVEKNKHHIQLIDFWVISTTPKIELAYKLLEIGSDMEKLIEKYAPQKISIEKLFFTNNIKTAIDVAQCRGVIMYEGIKHHLQIREYTPLQVKKAITWSGRANKKQMQQAIKMIMKLEAIPTPDDAADALCLAYMWALESDLNF